MEPTVVFTEPRAASVPPASECAPLGTPLFLATCGNWPPGSCRVKAATEGDVAGSLQLQAGPLSVCQSGIGALSVHVSVVVRVGRARRARTRPVSTLR